MTPICPDPRFDREHFEQCSRDVIAVAGELLPLIAGGELFITDLRRAIAGFHECHTLALLSELAAMFGKSEYTVDGVRAWLAYLTLEAATR